MTVEEAKCVSCFKFVHMESGDMRLFNVEFRHSDMVLGGENAIGAGLASYWPAINNRPARLRIDSPYSELLRKKTTEKDCQVLAEMFGCPVEFK